MEKLILDAVAIVLIHIAIILHKEISTVILGEGGVFDDYE